jgi:hypothetical protein
LAIGWSSTTFYKYMCIFHSMVLTFNSSLGNVKFNLA